MSKLTPNTVDEVREILLRNRDIDEKSVFFSPLSPLDLTLEELNLDPSQMKKAVGRLGQAIENQEDVVIVGDYDADGVCATAILWKALKTCGLIARPFIPHRTNHGYGLSQKALDELLKEKKPDLIITVDNGIVAHGPIKSLGELGVDVIVTDHHEVDPSLLSYPPALAVVHTTQLCGATVAWMLARELFGFRPDLSLEIVMTQLLDFCAIATVADQMPLVGAHRSFTFFGLKVLRQNQRLGLLELYKQAKIDPDKITARTIGFNIAPRINAVGRLGHAVEALRLLCTTNKDRAKKLAELLCQVNTQRQDLTRNLFDHAKTQAESWKDEHLIIVSSSSYHEGVVGLIAGNLVREFYKPAIALSIREDTAKASARGVDGVDIIGLIRQVKDDLLEAGGHKMAAGFSVSLDKLDAVKSKLQLLAKEQISGDLLVPRVDVECGLSVGLVGLELAEMLEGFAPFGRGNRQPVFSLENVKVLQAQTMGRDSQHLKFYITSSDDSEETSSIPCLHWRHGNLAPELEPGTLVDVAGVIEINNWRGKKKIQLMVRELKVTNPPPDSTSHLV